MYWDKVIEFYSEWDNDSSDILIKCDEELQFMCRLLDGLDLKGVKSLKEYYESNTIDEMTEKIKSIKAFKGIETPMIKTEYGYIPDFKSRYFLEDFAYGLCIIKGFADVLNMNTPNIDKVINWYERISGVEYFKESEFLGCDLKGLPIPKNYGLKNKEDIIKYYNK